MKPIPATALYVAHLGITCLVARDATCQVVGVVFGGIGICH